MTPGSDEVVGSVVDQARDAFWSVVARSFPGVGTGDLSPEAAREIDEAMRGAVELWLEANGPTAAAVLASATDLERGAHLAATAHRDGRQAKVYRWVLDVFTDEVAGNTNERIRRFTEESLELAQAVGLSEKDAVKLVRYVYGRPTGDVKQEIGGVSLTLLALCQHLGVSAEATEIDEVRRMLSKNRDALRAKHASKVAAGVAK